jgi:hypothetical protein
VVRNGFHAERALSTSAGTVQVKAPGVNDRRIDQATGERHPGPLARGQRAAPGRSRPSRNMLRKREKHADA